MSSENIFAVYRNLNNGFLSIQNLENELVVGHCDSIKMTKVSFKVSMAGIKRIRNKRVKSVVAKVVGELAKINGFVAYKGRSHGPYLVDNFEIGAKRICFDPYKWDGFVDESGILVGKCNSIFINKDGLMLK